MTTRGGRNCFACRRQHRRCGSECPLAPFFPLDQPQRFENARRLFGVSNILKILSGIDPALQPDAMRSIIYESDCRAHFPVEGCLAVIRHLLHQLRCAEIELAFLTNEIAHHRSQMEHVDYNQPRKTR
ncbi:unnamed protein product [Spirodela intermedia]|uniref:LOB domain-containing protein n=1 Tax=Spirodela intermedia TaxID=51605 RepID=A0A7I8JXR7_SPIIN|nr:unnamed protein product [Spirodela intermedia]